MELSFIKNIFPMQRPGCSVTNPCALGLRPQKPKQSEKPPAIHQRATESMKFWDDILFTIYFSVEKINLSKFSVFSSLIMKISLLEHIIKATVLLLLHLYLLYVLYCTSLLQICLEIYI